MAVKFFMVVLSVVAAAKAGDIVQAVDEYDPHPQYSYGYDVQDSLTGDYKSQQESRDGDVVQGSYSLVESDGTRRIVDYTADPFNGFNAIVRKEPLAVAAKAVVAPVVAKAYAPLAYSAPAPILTKSYSPLAYSSPLAYHSPAPVAPLTYNNPILAKSFYNPYSSPIVANAPLTYSNLYAH